MRRRMDMVGIAVAAGVVMGTSGGVLPSGQPAAAPTGCTGGTSTDFNGDGVTDTIIADPGATVGGAARAGLVRVVLGGGKGVFEISQATSGMNATPERGDQFGYARAAYDADGDSCTDLVVGAPYEDVPQDGKNLIDAGRIWVVHGPPDR